MHNPSGGQAILDSALAKLKHTATEVRQCPACHSHQIYTTLNVAFFYDHTAEELRLSDISNLAEHGWHACQACDHRWVSNTMLQSAVSQLDPPEPTGKVIPLPNRDPKEDD